MNRNVYIMTFQSSDNTKKTPQKCSYCDWYTSLVNYCSDLVIVHGLTNLENIEIKKTQTNKQKKKD